MFWSKVWTVVWKDVRSEARAKDIVTSVVVFALLVIVVFAFAFAPGPENIGIVAPGVLWVAFTFAGVLGLNRAMILEKDRGCLEGLMLCPVERDVIYWGKMVSTFLFMFVVELVVMPLFGALLDLPLYMPRLLLIAFLATVGFVGLGTLFSAIAVNTRAREILLPILFFPMVTPILIAAVESSALVIERAPWSEITSWLVMLVALDVIFLVLASFTFQFVLEE